VGILNGDEIILDQANDTADTGGFMVCEVAATCTFVASGIGRILGGIPRAQQQRVTVTAGCATACTGSNGGTGFTLTISPGLYANNWAGGGKTPGIWFAKGKQYIGLENLTLDHSGNPTVNGGVGFMNCRGCWVKNVRSIKVNKEHVLFYGGSRNEVRDSYFFQTMHYASQSYGIDLYPSNDCLIENNVFQQITSPILSGSSGNVFGYNFSINNVVNNASYSQGSYMSHNAGGYMNLWEGNVMNSILTDDLHGTSGLGTIFRNWLNGLDWNTCTVSGGECANTNNYANHPNQQTNAVVLVSFTRGSNVIGNVMGTPGYHTVYTQAYPAGGSFPADIMILGYNDPGGGDIAPNDSLVGSNTMVWGNYDTVNGSVGWSSVAGAPGALTYISATTLPASHTLPASFYLSSRPVFFTTPQGTFPFPLIGPDISSTTAPFAGGFFGAGTYNKGICPVGISAGGATCATAVGGHANLNPAMNAYFNLMGGPADGSGSTALPFDAGTFYNTSPSCSISPTSIGPYTAGQTVSQQFSATNCSSSNFTIVAGSLTGSGLSLNPSGLLSGTAVAGSYSFTVAYDTATDPVSLTINASGSQRMVSISGSASLSGGARP
jgi:hypothetical protein